MMRARAILWLILVLLLAAGAFAVLRSGAPIQTNLLALLPDTQRNPTAERALTQLGAASERRSVFLIGAASSVAAKEAARRFERMLAQSGVFRDVRSTVTPPSPAALREMYVAHRFQVLAENDRAALAAGSQRGFIEERLRRRLYEPFRAGAGVPIDADPLGLLDAYLAALPFNRLGATLEFDDGFLLARDEARTYAVVFGELNGSPHDPAVQKPLQAALAGAEDELRHLDPQATVLRTGVVHYAAAARESAEHDIDRIAVVSILGIAALLLLVFRSPRPLALGLVSVATGVCAGAVATVSAFGGVHLITLVFGASLIGEAIDYSIQYYAARLDAGAAWDPHRGLQAIFPGISIAVATSILGYGAFALAPFPALRQIALFCVVGLLAAYITVVLLLPAVSRAPVQRAPQALLRGAARLLELGARWRRPRWYAAALVLFVFAGLPGWARLNAEDDIRLLIAPPAALLAQEAAVRRLTGFVPSGQFFVVEGRDADDVLEREEALTARLRALMQRGELGYYQAVSDFVPSKRRQGEVYALWRDRVFAPPAGFSQALRDSGFRTDVVRRYANEFRESADRRLSVGSWLQSPVSAPLRHLWLGESGGTHAAIVIPTGFKSVAVLQQTAQDLAGVQLVDKAGDVSRLFREYRRAGAWLLALAAMLVAAVLWWRYRWRGALVAFVPTAAAIGITLAAWGYAGAPLTLFHIMALLLVLGVGINYVIFQREGDSRRAAVLIGVLLSALTTLLSFGLLAWSGTPALSQFGATLFVGISVTVVLSFLLGVGTERSRA